jgi:hypothetical protein
LYGQTQTFTPNSVGRVNETAIPSVLIIASGMRTVMHALEPMEMIALGNVLGGLLDRVGLMGNMQGI